MGNILFFIVLVKEIIKIYQIIKGNSTIEKEDFTYIN